VGGGSTGKKEAPESRRKARSGNLICLWMRESILLLRRLTGRRKKVI